MRSRKPHARESLLLGDSAIRRQPAEPALTAGAQLSIVPTPKFVSAARSGCVHGRTARGECLANSGCWLLAETAVLRKEHREA